MVNHSMYSDDEDSQEDQCVNYKQKYRALKKNLRYLIYENECFQDELRKAQYNFVSISRDKSFLLDRILNYEKPQNPSSESEATESSDEENDTKFASSSSHLYSHRKKITKRKKSEAEAANGNSNMPTESVHLGHIRQLSMKQGIGKPASAKGNLIMKKSKKNSTARKGGMKKEKDSIKQPEDKNLIALKEIKNYNVASAEMANKEQADASEQQLPPNMAGVEFGFSSMTDSEGHLTREEVERHLESRRFSPELNTTATVPAELFSHEPDPESDFDDGEICEFIQLEEDGANADVLLE